MVRHFGVCGGCVCGNPIKIHIKFRLCITAIADSASNRIQSIFLESELYIYSVAVNRRIELVHNIFRLL